MAIEIVEFSHEKWWFSIVFCKRLPGRVSHKQKKREAFRVRFGSASIFQLRIDFPKQMRVIPISTPRGFRVIIIIIIIIIITVLLLLLIIIIIIPLTMPTT